jgi:hypothetical protein
MIRQIYCFASLSFLSLNTFAQYSKYVDPDDGLGAIPQQGMGSLFLTLVIFAIFFIILDRGGKKTFIRVVAYLFGLFAYLGLIIKLGMILQEAISPTKSGQGFIENSYRVLMTRAREGMVIWVPEGDVSDKTRLPKDLDRVYSYLIECGAEII